MLRFWTLFLCLTPSLWAQGAEGERAAVIAAVQGLFDAMERQDAAALSAAFLPEAQLVAVRRSGQEDAPRVTPAQTFVERMAAAPERWLERIWDSQVLVDGSLAMLWAPYDFHRGNRFSHCGIDAVTLLKQGQTWKVAMIAFTTQADNCPSSPLPAPAPLP